MSKKGTGKLILGAGLGAGLALLFAPKKGSELREDLKCKINELVNKAKEVDTEEVKENLENKIDEIKENPKDVLQGTFDDVKEKINEFIDDNFAEDDNIHISEDEIVISRTFSDEGDNK